VLLERGRLGLGTLGAVSVGVVQPLPVGVLPLLPRGANVKASGRSMSGDELSRNDSSPSSNGRFRWMAYLHKY
jgi:hypothetical protein